MKPNKTIEQYADEYACSVYKKHRPSTTTSATPVIAEGYSDCYNSYLTGAAKQKELDAEKINDYEQALEFCASEDLFTSNSEYEEMFKYNYKEWFQDKAREVLKKWGICETDKVLRELNEQE